MAKGDPIPWTALPYSTNPWTDYGFGWQPGQYMKDAAGWVNLRGLLATTVAVGPTSTIATMPVGTRPQAANELFIVIYLGAGIGFSRLDIYQTDGHLSWNYGSNGNINAGASGYLSLSGVRWFAGF